ncbi:MAG: SUF system NifU family Fe-S cluster assembly protein [Candidatus Micrarchaeota archaeon]|nr:SUF system NifU family Fe-S cluster assembly protein [Candidatus Micrarchaeota archaeon]
MMDAERIYRENILDHYKRPRRYGRMEGADAESEGANPVCGDEIRVWLKLKGERIEDARFEAAACAICTASASMLLEQVVGKKTRQALGMGRQEVLALLGINPGPARLKCALLPLEVLKAALKKPASKGGGKDAGKG